MTTLAAITGLSALRGPVAIAAGVFDGVHLGHRAVIAQALEFAEGNGGTAVVLTFDPHPASVLRPDAAPSLITSTRHKLRILARMGVENTLVVPFTKDFAATAPPAFIEQLAAACKLRQICVGHDWAFGKGRAGNLALLSELGAKLGFKAVGIPSVAMDGQPVSSTAIRAAIQGGDLTMAERFLGRPFSIFGTVIAGNQLGRTIGFPTANIRPESEQLPPNGVYAVGAEVGGEIVRGVANIGLRPTVETAAKERLLEVHLFDFTADLYGADLEVHFHRFIRAEQKFASFDALKLQIAIDAEAARRGT
jgi:riboflavin kinase / FMN adenylyltransferase